jgi:uncharacterized membrane protein YdbT with pleckstrin-like domain
MEEQILWEGKPASLVDSAKRGLNGISYVITNERLFVKSGLISKKEEELELYRVKDVKVTQSLRERAQKIGQIEIISTDKTTPNISLKNVKNPFEVKEILRNAIRESKKENNVAYREDI